MAGDFGNKSNSQEEVRYCCGLSNMVAAPIAMCAFIVSSIGCVYYNKYWYQSLIPYPVFMSWAQQLIGMAIMSAFLTIRGVLSGNEEMSASIPLSKRLYRYKYAIFVAFCFCMNISLNNRCLMNSKVSMYAIAKSTTVCYSLLLQYVLLGIKAKLSSVLSCFVIIGGVLVGISDQTFGLHPKAFLLGTLSSFFQSLYSVAVKYTVPHCDNSTTELLLHVQELSCIILLILSFSWGEMAGVMNSNVFAFISAPSAALEMWVIMAGSAILAICLNQCTYLVVSLTTPATYNVTGLVKQALQTAGGFVLWKDKPKPAPVVGACLTLAGSALYTATKLWDSTPKNAKQEEAVKEQARLSVGTGSDAFENPLTESGNQNEKQPLIPEDKCEKGQA
ncbi:Triose-phosphate Transporter family protein [Cryptosporidium felis]|nr:Triose-phosphate Transporter family protein [Cryptosporidium felis]